MNQKGLAQILLLGFIAAVLIAGLSFGYVKYFKNENTNTAGTSNENENTNTVVNVNVNESVNANQNTNISIDETADWETYTNFDLGIQFKYPKTLTASQQESLPVIDVKNGDTVYYGFNVGTTENTPISNKVTNPECYNEESTKNINSISWSINEFLCGIGTTPNATYYSTTNDNKVVEVSYNVTVDSIGAEQLEQILSTFQFTSTDETADWETYNNDEYGFIFKYPGNWQVEEVSMISNGVCVSQNNTDFCVIPDGASLDEDNIVSTEGVTLAGENSVKQVRNNLGNTTYPDYTTYIFNSYRKNGWTENNHLTLLPSTNSDISVLETILSTFQFTE